MQFVNPLSLLFLLVIAPLYALATKPLTETELTVGPLLRIPAPEKATASVILLHGVGSNATRFLELQQRYHSQERFRHINFIFPNAPLRDNLIFHQNTEGGVFQNLSRANPIAPSWFNISMLGLEGGYNETQYWQSVDYISDLIANETKVYGIPPHRIVAGGFSQGGMVSLGAIASSHIKTAGWLLFPTEIPRNLTQFNNRLVYTNKKTPVFHGHGLNDTIIYVSDGIRSANLFKSLGFNYKIKLYNGMTHQINWEPNFVDVEEWVAKIIPKKWHKGLIGWK